MSQASVSGFPEKGLTSGEVWETSGEVRATSGKSGKLPGNPCIAVNFPTERSSGEVAEKLPGKFGELPEKSGDSPEARGSLTPPSDSPNLSPNFATRTQLGPFFVLKFVRSRVLGRDLFNRLRSP